jgi:RNA polymerase sigma-70 factor (ECF subfamily)
MKQYDEEFIRSCKKGDRKLQKVLFEELYAPMFRICMRYVGHEADAEDCMMKGFMKVFQKLEKFRYDGDHSLYAWIRRIMVNESLMFIRQKHNFLISIEDKAGEVILPPEIIQQHDAEELNAMIQQLPTGYRTVFNLNVVEGYDHREISKMLGITESTSRTQLAKAKSKLRNMLEQNNLYNENAGR